MIDNRTGIHVKRHQRKKDTRPAVERFFDHVEEIFMGRSSEPCWRWKERSDLFWVCEGIVTTPWRFIYGVHTGRHVKKGANFRRNCNTLKCCQPAHLEPIETHCKKS